MILMYHKIAPVSPTMWWVSVDDFYRQLCELRSKEVVYLDDYDPTNPNQAVITFDGVYENVFQYAAPLLEKFHYPYELFITSNAIGKDNSFDTPEPHAMFANNKQLQHMVARGGRLQWHTRSHPNMGHMSDEKAIKKELQIPKKVKTLDPQGFSWFAYPYGEFNDIVVTETKKKFAGALSCNQGNDSDTYVLNRITVENTTSLSEATVGVVIASYNYGRFLPEAIESVLRQTRPADKIIIANDASTDSTKEIADSYQQQYPELISVIHHNKNQGIIKNFNAAVKKLDTDYVCILGADNRFRSDYLEKTTHILDEQHSVGVAYTDFALFGPRARVVFDTFEAELKGEVKEDTFFIVNFPDFTDEIKKRLKERNVMHGSSLFRKKLFNELKGYRKEGTQPEDHNFFLRAVELGWDARRCPEPLLEYRQHSRDQANTKLSSVHEALFYKKLSKNLTASNQELQQQLTQTQQQATHFSEELEKRNKDIEKIQSAKTYKVWQMATKVKKKIVNIFSS